MKDMTTGYQFPDLTHLFAPRSIAVIGASEKEHSIGNHAMKNIVEHSKFEGRLYPVNPKQESVMGMQCYPDVASLPEPVDVIVVVIPAKGVRTAIEQAGEIGSAVGAAGRLADLIVVANSVSRWEQPFRPILDACLRWTGRPILVTLRSVPDGIAQHVAIAWNDTVQSARAVAGAMPILRKAASVTVLTAQEGGTVSQSASPDKLVEYLGMHGVEANARTVSGKHRYVPHAIIDSSLSEQADLLVLGSVIHSRAHSLVYGSLTEEVLKTPRISALLVP